MNPALVEASRRRALDCANEIRHRRSVLKEELRDGEVILGEVLIQDPDYLQTMRLWDLLLATPGVGKARADQVFRDLKYSTAIRLESIPIRRRCELLAYMRLRFPSLPSVAA
jgi:hypothetical protein